MAKVKHLKKDDLVVALSGTSAGKSGKVIEVNQSKGMVKVEGIGIVKKHTKPTQTNPKGGINEQNKWMPASKFQVCNESGKGLGRAGYKVEGSKKERVFGGKKRA